MKYMLLVSILSITIPMVAMESDESKEPHFIGNFCKKTGEGVLSFLRMVKGEGEDLFNQLRDITGFQDEQDNIFSESSSSSESSASLPEIRSQSDNIFDGIQQYLYKLGITVIFKDSDDDRQKLIKILTNLMKNAEAKQSMKQSETDQRADWFSQLIIKLEKMKKPLADKNVIMNFLLDAEEESQKSTE